MSTVYQQLFQLLGSGYFSDANTKDYFAVDPQSNHEILINSKRTNRLDDNYRVFITMDQPGIYQIDDDGDSLNAFELDRTGDKPKALAYLNDAGVKIVDDDVIAVNYPIKASDSTGTIAMALVNRIHRLIQVQIALNQILTETSTALSKGE